MSSNNNDTVEKIAKLKSIKTLRNKACWRCRGNYSGGGACKNPNSCHKALMEADMLEATLNE